MSVYAGVKGAVNGVSSLRSWQVSHTSDTKKYVASNTLGGAGRVRGIRDWSGNYGAYGCNPAVLPGDIFSFAGYTHPAAGDAGVGPVYGGSAIVDQIQLNWNWETGDLLQHTLNFSGAGAFSQTSVDIVDETLFLAPSSLDVTIQGKLEDGEYANICAASAALTLTSENQEYANACTGGYKSRRPGNFDWTLALVLQEADLDALFFGVDDLVALKLGVGNAEYWEMQWGIVKEFSNLQVNRETGAIIGATCNIEMAGILGDGTVGFVDAPGEVRIWGDEGSS